jgi:hypothetical protein
MNAVALGVAESTGPVPEHEQRRKQETYPDLVTRLSVQSVRKHYDAYQSIDWDAPEMQIRRDDLRWELSDDDVLGATAWYKAQPQAARAELGLAMTASMMKLGLVFENILQRGLLEFAVKLPNRSPEFRYAYHEVIEEAQHSLMFQEFINRSGEDPGSLPRDVELGARMVVRFGRVFPEMFFFFVLGGEEPIDHLQRRNLRSGRELHPLLKRIMQIHVTEEARHLCFARNYLQQSVPRLGFVARTRLSMQMPIMLGTMARMMLEPSQRTIERFAIPAEVVREAYTDNREHKLRVRESLSDVVRLCIDLGLVTPQRVWLWRFLGLGNPFRYAAAR